MTAPTSLEHTDTVEHNSLAQPEETMSSVPPKPQHPWGKYVVRTLAVLVVVGAFAFWYLHNNKAKSRTLYTIAAAEKGDVAKTVTASGTLKAWSVVDIKSKAGGKVESLTVEIGDHVTKGQVIARIDPSDSLLTVQETQTDLASANAKQDQSSKQYQLQIRQSGLSVTDAQAQLQASQANLDVMQSKLKTAQDQSNAQPGLTNSNISAADANYRNSVKVRSQLDATQPQDLASAQSTYDQAVATAENNLANTKRQRALLAKGFVAQTTVDQAETAGRVADAQVTAAKTRLSKLEMQQQIEREAADAKTAQAQAQLENARAQSADIRTRANAVKEAEGSVRQAQMQVKQSRTSLALAQANRSKDAISFLDIASAKASVSRSRATLTNASKTLYETTVRCPRDGVVLDKYVEQGTIITSGQSFNSTGTSIVQVGDISKMYVNVSVDETDIAAVAEGQPVDFTVDAFKGTSFDGKVARISPQATVANNVTTYAVRVEIDNSSETFRRLRPGMNATCKFVVGAKKNVVTVPAAALHTDERGTYVDIPSGGTSAFPGGSEVSPPPPPGGPEAPEMLINVRIERRSVEIGLAGNDAVEIVNGIQEGEKIIVQTTALDQATTAAKAASGSPFGGGGPPPGGPPPGGGPPSGGGRH